MTGMMKKSLVVYTPDSFVADLLGWRLKCVKELRATVLGAAPLDEQIKWGHLVYISNGPVVLIRAEDERVLLGFWRGQRMRSIEPRLKPGGKYETATIELRDDERITRAVVQRLVKEAVALNEQLGDPTKVKRTT